MPDLGAPHLLLVEDYEPNILVASFFLEQFGFTCDVARNGVDGVAMAKAGIYSAIVMDVRMQGLDGYEATRLIRAHELGKGRARVPVIGLTAYAMPGDRERCIAAGMDDYVAKPIDEKVLKEKLMAVLGRGQP